MSSFVNGLSAGDVGCLPTGTYTGDVRVSSDGVTLQSAPGQRATLQVGTLEVPNDAEDVTISDLNIVGRADALTTRLTGARFRFLRNDVTNNNQGRDQIGSCILVGESDAMSSGGLISGNKIHNCGTIGSNFGHGIYTQNVGPERPGLAGLTITGNVMYGFGSYAIQLYPKAHGVIVQGNVIDGGIDSIRGGIVIDGDSSGHVITQNVIAWTETGGIVQRVGSGHVASDNCFWQNPSDVSGSSIELSGDMNADPMFVNRAAGDYRMAAESPCLSKVGTDPAALFLTGGQAPTLAPYPTIEPGPALATEPTPQQSTVRAPQTSTAPAPQRSVGDEQAPAVKVTSPEHRSRTEDGQRLTGEAEDTDGSIDRVELRIDGRLEDGDLPSLGASHGTYTITADVVLGAMAWVVHLYPAMDNSLLVDNT